MCALAHDVASGDSRSMVSQHRASKRQQFAHAWISHAIVDLLALTPRLDESTPAQASQVRGDTTLWRVYGLDQCPHAAFARWRGDQQLQQADASRVTQGAEETRVQISRLLRLLRR